MKNKGIFTALLTIAVSLMLAGGSIAAQTEYCKDLDGDGYGDPTDCESVQEEFYVDNSGDCNDKDENINPGVLEDCTDTIDNNCINGINEGCDGGNKQYYYHDADGDGWGDPNDFEFVSKPSPFFIERPGDCAPNNSAINPDATEICSLTDPTTDENCSGAGNEGCQSWWQDGDHDSYSTGSNLYDMSAPADYVLEATLVSTTAIDCADGYPAINPAATEICSLTDLTDENCNTVANEGCLTWWEDYDGDAFTTGNTIYDMSASAEYVLEASLVSTTAIDCADGNPAINPGAEEIYGDQIDDNCDNDIGPYFPDPMLDHCVTFYTKGSYDPVNVAAVTQIGCSGITDVTGIEYLPALTLLNLNFSNLSDWSFLSELHYLDDLRLYGNNLTDLSTIPLADLKGLTLLDLRDNPLSDLTGLENLTMLSNLQISNANLSAPNALAPLFNLTKLYILNIVNSSVSDLTGLGGHSSLDYLTLSGNNISDLSPLSTLTTGYMNRIQLSNNNISDLTPLSSLTRLENLTLSSNNITNLTGLGTLTGLKKLYLNDNNITNVSELSPLTNLTYLWLQDNSIDTLEGLDTLSLLDNLRLNNNYITDLSPLIGLTNMRIIWLNYNCITDFSPVVYEGGPWINGMESIYQQHCSN